MICKYNDFLLESALVKESIVYYSPKLRDILKNISSPISKSLIGVETVDIKPDMTFMDIDKEDYLSFTTMRNAMKMVGAKYPPDTYKSIKMDSLPDLSLSDAFWRQDMENKPDGITGIYLKSRSQIRIGRLVNRLFPGKYTDKQIETFVNKFKASLENSLEKFVVVEGEEIEKWYSYEKHYENTGTLGNSCMKNSTGIFDIYIKNPQVCRMLILTEGGKLKGRALVWKVLSAQKNIKIKPDTTPQFEYFMDRQYTISDSLVERFRNYATDQGWAYKTTNNHHSFNDVAFKGEYNYLKMTVQLNIVKDVRKVGDMSMDISDCDYKRYPYMDTFRRYDVSTGILYNDDNREGGNAGQYILESTDGGFEEIENGNWSDYYGEVIPEGQEIYSENMSDYLYRNRSVEVTRGNRRNRGIYPDDSDSILYDDTTGDHLNEEDAVYSEYHSTYILADNAVDIVAKVTKYGNCHNDPYFVNSGDDCYVSYDDIGGSIWFKIISKKFRNWEDHHGILGSLLERDSDNNFILSKFAITVYSVVKPDKLLDAFDNIDYLFDTDADILNCEIDKSDFRKTDAWTYTHHLETNNLLPIIEKMGQEILSTSSPRYESDSDKREIVLHRIAEIADRRYQL